MNLTVTFEAKEDLNDGKIVDLMCAIKRRVEYDFSNGYVCIYDCEAEHVKKVIDEVNSSGKSAKFNLVPTEADVISKFSENASALNNQRIGNGPVQKSIEQLLGLIHWAMYLFGASSEDISEVLNDTCKEISMKYSPSIPPVVSRGDVVECNFGYSLNGENFSQNAIVCNVDEENGLIYIVPVSTRDYYKDEKKFFPLNEGIDIEYYDSTLSRGTVLINMGRYVSKLRMKQTIGYMMPNAFNNLLKAIPKGVTFEDGNSNRKEMEKGFSKLGGQLRGHIIENGVEKKTPDNLQTNKYLSSERPVLDSQFATSSEVQAQKACLADIAKKNDLAVQTKKVSKCSKKDESAEDYLANVFYDAINALDKTKDKEEVVQNFLKVIGWEHYNIIVKHAFVVSCFVKKVRYENIVVAVKNKYYKDHSEKMEKIIKNTLKEEFKEWLDANPSFKEKYPKASIIDLLKLFSKIMK